MYITMNVNATIYSVHCTPTTLLYLHFYSYEKMTRSNPSFHTLEILQ